MDESKATISNRTAYYWIQYFNGHTFSFLFLLRKFHQSDLSDVTVMNSMVGRKFDLFTGWKVQFHL